MWSAQSNQRRTRQAARGKEALLAAAATVIAGRGLDQVRFADIAAATGAAISTLQYYFGSREDLLIAVIDHVTREELRQLREIGVQPVDPRERLARLVALGIGESDSFRESRILWIEVWRAALRNDELHSLHAQRYEAWLAILRDTLQEGIERGVFPRTASPYDAAVQILAVIDGLTTPLLTSYPALDCPKARRLALETIAATLKIDTPLPEIA